MEGEDSVIGNGWRTDQRHSYQPIIRYLIGSSWPIARRVALRRRAIIPMHTYPTVVTTVYVSHPPFPDANAIPPPRLPRVSS